MKKFFGFLWLIIVTAVFPFLLSGAQLHTAQQEDLFGGDNVDAVIFRAEAGDVEAQMALAQRYRFGVDVPLDPAKAVEWFQKAAEQGSVQGQFSVGYMYASGENGFKKDLEKAAKWFRKAAENGHANAQTNLGNMYSIGEGVEKNPETALFWFQKAADQGYAQAQIEIGRIYATGDGVPRDIGTAIALYQKMADEGNANAQFLLALRYINGDGVARDPQKAIELYRKATDQGHAGAQINLANIYAEGKLTRKNLAAAIELYQKAAEQGLNVAQYQLGMFYYNGRGVKKDRAAAAQWFQKAANQKNYLAQEDLGRMYLKGEGVIKDEIEGLAWLYLADSNDPRPSFMITSFSANSDIATLEKKLGAKKTLAARQRSGKLRQAINAEIFAKTGVHAPEPVGNPISVGAGAVISRNGLILTTASIVAGAESIKIKTSLSSQTFLAEILEIDIENDLAILKYKGSATPLSIVSSGHICVGQDVFSILSPRPVENSPGVSYSSMKIHELTGTRKNPGYFQIGVSVNVAPGPGIQMDETILRNIRINSSERLLNSFSGPVVDESGNIIGMIPHRAVSNNGTIYVTRSEVMQPLLEKYSVEVVDPSENENVKSAGNNAAGFIPPLMQKLMGRIVMILAY